MKINTPWLWATLFFTLAIFALTHPLPLLAQEPLRIQQLRVQVMPEFDDPRVLVIVQGRLSGDSDSFPREVTFFVPAGAQINQMAAMNVATGQTTPQVYDTLPHPNDPRWTAVSYTLENAHFFYEFYYNPLPNNADKQFTYVFNSPLSIDDLQVEVQQPKTAENFTLAPAANNSRVDNFGLTVHQVTLAAVAAGADVSVEVSYRKSDTTPSVSREQVMALQGGEEETAVSVTNPHTQPDITQERGATVLVGLAGLAGVAVIGRFFWLRHTPVTHKTHRAKFCSQCGSALKAEADFCHECGEAVA